MKNFLILFCAVCGLMFSSCFQKALTPREYFNWAKTSESGLKQSHAGKGVVFELQFRPKDLMIANEIKNGVIAESDCARRQSELGNLAYFLLKIESGEQDLLMHNIADEQEYVRRVNYYSLDFQQDIIAVAGTDTIPCVLYQFENAYGITPYINISLAFPREFMEANRDKDVEIMINDQVFGNGIMKFNYTENAFHDLPELISE